MVIIFIGFLYAQNTVESINVQCTIRDSLSKATIPCVRVTIENLNKSFTTLKSAFYPSLPPGEYIIILEAPDYETLKKQFNVSATNNNFVFEMVKLTDRSLLSQQYNTFTAGLDSFNYSLKNMDMPAAKKLFKTLQEFRDRKFFIDDKIIQNYYSLQKTWIDSLMNQARIKEDSTSYAEAFYYYRKVVEFDSSQVEAINGMHRVDSLLLIKNKPQSTGQVVQSVKKSKTPEEIEILFQSGVSKFIAGEFKDALKIFKEVLKYNPNHSKAQEYLKRTEARLKILEGK